MRGKICLEPGPWMKGLKQNWGRRPFWMGGGEKSIWNLGPRWNSMFRVGDLSQAFLEMKLWCYLKVVGVLWG